MVALGVIICSEVCNIYMLLTILIWFVIPKNNGVFPEAAVEVKNILERWGFSDNLKQIISYYKEFVQIGWIRSIFRISPMG